MQIRQDSHPANGAIGGLDLVANLAPALALGLAINLVVSLSTLAQPPDEAPPPQAELDAPLSLGPLTEQPAAAQHRVPVETTTLQQVPLVTAGPLTGEQGLGANMWQGTPRNLAEKLLETTPPHPHAATQRQLLEKLLLTAAPPPARGNAVSTEDDAWLKLRLSALDRVGLPQWTVRLTDSIPEQQRTPDLLLLRFDALLLTGSHELACLELRTQSQDLVGPEWTKNRAFCHFLASERQRGMLAAAAAREQDPNDRNFAALIDIITEDSSQLRSLSAPKPRDLALLRLSGQKAPEDIMMSSDPALMRALADNDSIAPDMRLRALERAVVIDAVPVESMLEILRAAPFEASELRQALLLVEKSQISSYRVPALLVQAFDAAQDDASRAEILHVMLQRLKGQGNGMNRLALYLLERIPPRPELAWFASEAAGAFYSADKANEAAGWFDLARSDMSRETQNKMTRLWPLRLIAEGKAADLQGQREFATVLLKADQEQGPERLARSLAVLDAMGEPVDPALWAQAIGQAGQYRASLPSTALLYRLEDVARMKQLAEVAAISARLIDQDGVTSTHASLIAHALSALKQAGLDLEARALALEALGGALL